MKERVTTVNHIPVLIEEIMTAFHPAPDDRLLDATLGLGGHAAAFLDLTAPTGTVVGIEADPEALATAQQRLAPYGNRITYFNRNFAQLKDSIVGGGILHEFTHVLFDLGIGSHQLSAAHRGFSFHGEQVLSMRYGEQTGLPDARIKSLNHVARRLGYLPDVPELLTHLTDEELAEVIWTYGEERYSRRIARALKALPLPTTAQAVTDRITIAVPAPYRHGRLHPATRTFQALRLAVNRELEALEAALPQALELLKPNGLMAVISFHSLEDRLVKQFFRREARSCICPPTQMECTCTNKPKLAIITKKPATPSVDEVNRNPRARSAKLRIASRLDTD